MARNYRDSRLCAMRAHGTRAALELALFAVLAGGAAITANLVLLVPEAGHMETARANIDRELGSALHGGLPAVARSGAVAAAVPITSFRGLLPLAILGSIDGLPRPPEASATPSASPSATDVFPDWTPSATATAAATASATASLTATPAISATETPTTPHRALRVMERDETFDEHPFDPVVIVEAAIEGDILALTVRYGGGCREHDFALLAHPAFMESYPVQSDVRLSHDARGDLCRALITERQRWLLTPLREHFEAGYPDDPGPIIVRLRGWERTLLYSW